MYIEISLSLSLIEYRGNMTFISRFIYKKMLASEKAFGNKIGLLLSTRVIGEGGSRKLITARVRCIFDTSLYVYFLFYRNQILPS